MLDIFSSTLPIFLITLLGSIMRRKWLTSAEFWRGLEKLSYFVLFPALLFNYVSTVDLGSKSLIKLIIGLIISTLLISAGLIYYRRAKGIDPVQFTSIFQGSIRYNSYILFALGGGLYGDKGLAIVSVVSSYMIIFTNFLSVLVFAHFIPNENSTIHKEKDYLLLAKLVCSNPLIISSICGFAFNILGFELNIGLKKTISSLSESALAIGMLNVGAGLKIVVDYVHLKQVLLSSFTKLVLLPIVTVIVLSLMSIDGTEKSVGILYSCLPCASSAFVLSRQLEGDPESMASIIAISTIFSILSLSVLMYILT